ncbi:MAG: PKD domain-containing protein [Thermoplasmata archaeon]|nr:PKD domain-containing protein [Thermoplasmata archaeon]MCI4355947.1 PKD domain-containing protein [Thermoplasmata archaeon]
MEAIVLLVAVPAAPVLLGLPASASTPPPLHVARLAEIATQLVAPTPASFHALNRPETIRVGTGPQVPVVDPKNGWVYVPNLYSDNVSVLNGTSVVGSVTLNETPVSATVDSSNGWVYIATEPNLTGTANPPSYVVVLNGTAVAASVALGVNVTISGSTYSSRNECVYEAAPSNDSVFVVNGTQLVAQLPTGNGPGSPVFDPVNGLVYVPNAGSQNVTALNGSAHDANGPRGSVVVGTGPDSIAIDPANGFAYVVNEYAGRNFGTVSVVNGTTLVATVSLVNYIYGYQPSQAFWDPLHGVLYVLSEGNGYNWVGGVAVIRGSTLEATEALALQGSTPYPTQALSATFDPAIGELYVTNATGGANVSLLSNTTILGNLSIGAGLQDGAYDPADGLLYIPVGGPDSTNLTVLNASAMPPSITGFTASPGPDPLGTTDVFRVNVSGPAGGLIYWYSGVYPQPYFSYQEPLPPGCASANSSTLSCEFLHPLGAYIQVHVVAPSGYSATAAVYVRVLPLGVASFVAAPSTMEIGSPTTGALKFDVNLSDGIDPFSYNYWSLPFGCSTANVSPLPCDPNATDLGRDDSYTFFPSVNVTDSAGNSVVASTQVVVYAPLTATVGVSEPVVDVGEPDLFSIAPVGGSPSVAYSWLFGDGSSSSLQQPGHAYASTGNYTVEMWANDSLGGTIHRTFSIQVEPALRATLTISNSSPTIGQSIRINVSASGGSGTYAYVYAGLPPGCVSVNASTIGCLPTQAGTYTLVVNATDANSGLAQASTTLTVVFGFTVVSPSSSVVGQPVTISVDVATVPGSMHYAYTGLPPGCESADSAQITCTPTSPGHYAVAIAVTNSVYGAAHKTVNLRVVSAGLGLGSEGLVVVVAVGVAVAAAVGIAVVRRRRRGTRRSPPVTSP